MANKPLICTISENYSILKVLGQGSFGQVVKCVKRDTDETVAVKVLKETHPDISSIKELCILKKLRCLDPDKSHIVRCYEWFHKIDRVFMVFEMLDMTLHDLMSQTKGTPLPLNGIQTIIKDVATALNALRGLGMIHTDLKLDNIMLVDHQRQPFRVKLIDFGLTLETSEPRRGMVVQTLWNRSPEVILGCPFTEAIDIWSLGTAMAKMLLGFPLFPGRHDYDVLCFIINLLGEPPKRLLNNGLYTSRFYHKRNRHLVFTDWKFMTPLEYYKVSRITPIDTRRYQFSSLYYLKTLNLHKGNSAEAAYKNACVELLKEMLQMDPRNRITPNEILEHPCIARSFPSPNSHNETAAAETSESRAVSNSDAAETKADDSCAMEVPPGVIMVMPAEETMQSEEATSISPQVVQNMITYSHLAEDDIVSTPSVPPNSCVEAHDSGLNPASNNIKSPHIPEVSEPKKKKKKKGIRGKMFSCLCVPEDDE